MLIYKLNIPLIFLHKGALCVAKIAVMRRMIHTKKKEKLHFQFNFQAAAELQ